MGRVTSISFAASKTIQEKQFEPIKLELSMVALVDEGEDASKVADDLEFRVYQELYKAQESYLRHRMLKREDLEREHSRLELVSRQLKHL